MATLREFFHAVANLHNRITISSGCTREILKAKPIDRLNKEELKDQQDKLVELFDKIENDTVEANKKIVELKEYIYKKIDPESTI